MLPQSVNAKLPRAITRKIAGAIRVHPTRVLCSSRSAAAHQRIQTASAAMTSEPTNSDGMTPRHMFAVESPNSV